MDSGNTMQKTENTTNLLVVTTGSRLTGFSLPSSDYDYLIVDNSTDHTGRVLKEGDGVRWSFGRFMDIANKSSHNALDAMFAPDDYCHTDRIKDFRSRYVANRYEAYKRFTKTIETASGSTASDPTKREIFTELLTYNLDNLMNYGRYDPTEFRRTRRGVFLYEKRLREWEEKNRNASVRTH